jgi:hypothetical protein
MTVLFITFVSTIAVHTQFNSESLGSFTRLLPKLGTCSIASLAS